MLRRIALTTSVCLLAPGCYLAHERGRADASEAQDASHDASSLDGAGPDDAPARDASACLGGPPATVTFEPALAGSDLELPISLLGIDAEPAVNGVRVHLARCETPSTCPLDVIISQIGEGPSHAHVPPQPAPGTLRFDARTGSAYVHVTDARRCARCGGELFVVAGALLEGLDTALSIASDPPTCGPSCAEQRRVRVSGHGAMVVATLGDSGDMPPLHAFVATSVGAPCDGCPGCGPIDTRAAPTGAIVTATGFFDHGP